MATPGSSRDPSTLLDILTSCLSSTASSLPKSRKDAPSDPSIEPPPDGISLLDTKSEILLSYLQHLVFLIIFQLRHVSSAQQNSNKSVSSDHTLKDDIVKKLVELRIFLDRGVRPLEGRLKYQVDKVIKAADDAERTKRESQSKIANKPRKTQQPDSDEASSDGEDHSGNGISTQYCRILQGAAPQKPTPASKATPQAPSDGIYRPPKIMPTALPTTERREREDRRPRRSNVIDEFVGAEMSSAPTAEPSIGSTILAGGRQTKSKKDREHEADRTTYEETNFIRLPKETKKEMAKRRGPGRETTYGGDEWKGLTEGADRIERLTRRAKGSGAALDKSRKRKANEGQRSDGVGMGQIFDKRRKKIEGWKR
ncbi:hypothetical protein NUU61_008377 [Penicillium alfredii]|uniref:Uncharacterized protein n=1 Tax=Penicillium alfredii TaxID=1506179 RepID=A0A9W9ESF8_9EURO|nr:uncharacterized protein NUU61_008377 [Penicillium alfredii]KAJ5087070.1 hypothetical protein NUU61_008377 [Penicillium alfredii]